MRVPPPVWLSGSTGYAAAHSHGAHLTSWTPEGEAPVLWLSSLARIEPGRAIRGGVPVVFPWFGAGRPGNLSPAHGFARTTSWEAVDMFTDGDDAVAVFALSGSDTVPDFPFAYAARYEIRAGRTLRLGLTVENCDVEEFSFEEALHAYLVVGDVRQVVVEGLDGCTFLDQAPNGHAEHGIQSGGLHLTAETDRIYASSGQVRVVDERLGRTLVIDKQHSADTVVWNPWVDKALRMDDFGDAEWPGMLCIEGANVREHAVVLGPGQSHTMRYDVSVERL